MRADSKSNNTRVFTLNDKLRHTIVTISQRAIVICSTSNYLLTNEHVTQNLWPLAELAGTYRGSKGLEGISIGGH